VRVSPASKDNLWASLFLAVFHTYDFCPRARVFSRLIPEGRYREVRSIRWSHFSAPPVNPLEDSGGIDRSHPPPMGSETDDRSALKFFFPLLFTAIGIQPVVDWPYSGRREKTSVDRLPSRIKTHFYLPPPVPLCPSPPFFCLSLLLRLRDNSNWESR